MRSKGKTDNRKITIMFSSNDFNVPIQSLKYAKVNN